MPLRIARQARSLSEETILTAAVSPRWVELQQRTSFAVRHGTLGSLEIRVPAAIADRWELQDKQDVHREELSRDSDGARRYRISFDRPVLEQATLRFRSRFPLAPSLEATSAREVAIPWISFNEGHNGAAKLGLSLAPEIVLEGVGPGWVRADDNRIEPPE